MYAKNHLKGNFPWQEYPGGYCQGAIIFGVIVWERSSRMQLSGRGGNFPRGNCPWSNYPGQLSGGQFFSMAIILGGQLSGGQ